MSNSKFQRVLVPPMDEYNQTLVSYVHLSDWINPKPADCYDLAVIGAGTAGLVVAAGAAGLGLGLKVALIEKHLMGGDCLNVGCVPSKCVIRSARVVGQVWKAENFGVHIPQSIDVDFPAVMARMRRLRAGISHHDSAERFQKLGVDVFLGSAKFSSNHTITDPEIAHVGMYEHQAQQKGITVNTIKIPLKNVDRAIADGEEEGFVKILHKKGSDQILGATIVASHAGEMISELTTAIVNKIGLSKLSSVIHPYPTQAEGIKKAADAYRRTLLTPKTKRLLGFVTKFS